MPARLLVVLDLDRVVDPAQAERAQRLALRVVRAVLRLDLGHLHAETVSSARRSAPGVGAAVGVGVVRVPSEVPSASLAGLGVGEAEHRVDRQAAQLRDLLGLAQLLQRVDRRLDEVDRVLRAEALREDVVEAGELEHRADAAAGDDAGTGRGRLEQHAAGAVDAERRVRDGRAVLGHAEEVLLGLLDALLDRQRDLAGLAVADADDVALVTHHDQRGEREATAALDDLRDAVDLDDPLLQVHADGADRAVDALMLLAHTASPPSRTPSAKAFTRPWYW